MLTLHEKVDFLWYESNSCYSLIQSRGTIVFSVELLWTFIKEKDASIYSTGEEEIEGKKMILSPFFPTWK